MPPSPSSPALLTPDTPAIPPVPSTGTSQPLNKPGVRYGAHIEGIAREYSLHPVDVAIGIAGVLINIAGPHGGLVDSGGGRVKPHLSLLRIGSTASHLHLLEQRRFHPLRCRANWLRQWQADAAGGQEKRFTERGLNPDVFDEMSLGGSMMYSGHPVRSSPGAVHLPSVCFAGTALDKIVTALSESIHREALLLLPVGGVFDPFHQLSPEDEPLGRDLVALLRGRDTEFAPLHPDQGPGTFEYAARWCENAFRLALVLLHAAEHGQEASTQVVSDTTANKAITLMNWFAAQQLQILSAGREEKRSARLYALRDILEEKPGRTCTLRDLKRRHAFEPAEVESLAKEHPDKLVVESVRPDGPGRPSRIVRLLV